MQQAEPTFLFSSTLVDGDPDLTLACGEKVAEILNNPALARWHLFEARPHVHQRIVDIAYWTVRAVERQFRQDGLTNAWQSLNRAGEWLALHQDADGKIAAQMFSSILQMIGERHYGIYDGNNRYLHAVLHSIIQFSTADIDSDTTDFGNAITEHIGYKGKTADDVFVKVTFRVA